MSVAAPPLRAVVQPRQDQHITLAGAEIDFLPGFLQPAHADQLLDRLCNTTQVDWRQDDIVIFGRRVAQPRLTAWIADRGIHYSYSGITMQPGAWTPELSTLRNTLQQRLGTRFNSVLLNLYRDGCDSMGWHRDNERSLGDQPVIASLSLGAGRAFDLRHRDYRALHLAPLRFELQHGDLLVMRGATQQHWQHRVPRQSRQTTTRINLSFRYILT